MRLVVGQKLVSVVDQTAVVVIRCPGVDVTVTCGGREMCLEPTSEAVPPTEVGDGVVLGKRYAAENADVELLCVKGGTSPVSVNGTPVAPKSPKLLPASD